MGKARGHRTNRNLSPQSDAVRVWQLMKDGKPNPAMVSIQDNRLHAEMKRPIAGIFSNSSVLAFEPKVAETMRFFMQRLDEEFASTGKRCDIDHWLQYCASPPNLLTCPQEQASANVLNSRL